NCGWPLGSPSIVTWIASLRCWRRKIDRHFCSTDARVGRLPPLINPAARPASRPCNSDSRWLAFATSFCKVIHCVFARFGLYVTTRTRSEPATVLVTRKALAPFKPGLAHTTNRGSECGTWAQGLRTTFSWVFWGFHGKYNRII